MPNERVSDELRWRKKPVVIEAWQFQSPEQFDADAPEWLKGQRLLNVHLGMLLRGHVIIDSERGSPVLFIGTLEGTVSARPGDWVIRGVQGELYPCKPDIFAKTYEPESRRAEEATATEEVVERVARALLESWRQRMPEEVAGEVTWAEAEKEIWLRDARAAIIAYQSRQDAEK